MNTTDRDGPRYDEGYLNHWADVFVARQVAAYGVKLDTFLVAPESLLVSIDTGRLKKLADLPKPLTRAQQAEQAVLRG